MSTRPQDTGYTGNEEFFDILEEKRLTREDNRGSLQQCGAPNAAHHLAKGVVARRK
jgi:hypothetical protein